MRRSSTSIPDGAVERAVALARERLPAFRHRQRDYLGEEATDENMARFDAQYAGFIEALKSSPERSANYLDAIEHGYERPFTISVINYLERNETLDDLPGLEVEDDRIPTGEKPDDRTDRERAADHVARRLAERFATLTTEQVEAVSEVIAILDRQGAPRDVIESVAMRVVEEALDEAEFVHDLDLRDVREPARNIAALAVALRGALEGPDLDQAARQIGSYIDREGDWKRCAYPGCDAYVFPVNSAGRFDIRVGYCADETHNALARANAVRAS